MATFGTTSNAGTTSGGSGNGIIVATKYTLSENGTLTSIGFWATVNSNAKVGIYSDSSGAPNSLLVANNTGTAVTSGQNNDLSVSSTALTAGTYWIAVLSDAANRAYIAGGTNQAAYNASTAYAGGCPSTFPAITNQNNDYISYGTYTPSVSGNPTSFGNKYRNIKVGDGMSRSEGAT